MRQADTGGYGRSDTGGYGGIGPRPSAIQGDTPPSSPLELPVPSQAETPLQALLRQQIAQQLAQVVALQVQARHAQWTGPVLEAELTAWRQLGQLCQQYHALLEPDPPAPRATPPPPVAGHA